MRFQKAPATIPSPPQNRLRFKFLFSPAFQRSCILLALSAIIALLMIDYVESPTQELQVGDVAEHDIRAPHNFEVTDPEATRQRRNAAENNVRPVFDFDLGMRQQIVSRVHEAFTQGRQSLPVDLSRLNSGKDAPLPLRPTLTATPSPAARLRTVDAMRPKLVSPKDPHLDGSQSTTEARDEFFRILAIEGMDIFYQNLVFLRFDATVEAAMCSLIETIMKTPIVADKSALPEDLSTLGITVTRLGEGSDEERSIYDRDQILALEDARRRASSYARDSFSGLPTLHQDTIGVLSQQLLVPSLVYDAAETQKRRQQARASVASVTYHVKKGTMMIRAGDPIDHQKYLMLRAIDVAREHYHPVQLFVSLSLLVLLLTGATYIFASTYFRKFSTSTRDLLTLSLVTIFVVALTRISVEIANALAAHIPSIPLHSYYYGIPIGCGAMVIRILMNSETALVFAVIVSALAAMLTDYNVFYLSYFFVASLAAAGGISHTKERVHVLRGGLLSAACNILGVLAIFLIQSTMADPKVAPVTSELPYYVAFALVGGLASAVLALGLIPFLEMLGYVTDYKLLELANMNHPLLKDLMLRAPGTYHHSVIVGNLSEAAAQAIHANALLARVGCYYHDIGKMRKPEYFIENLRNVAENRHDRLPPHMSALIVSSHVRDGIEMGRNHRLPQSLIDLIPQHHGTALISFFFNKARQNASDGEIVNENDFRYPGPKPQTREAGIVMLADATEASTRSIKQVNPAKIRTNLQKIFQRIVNDGQLDECPLTLKDLGIILESFHQTLLGIYHNRIEYPPEFQSGAAIAGEGTGAVIGLDPEIAPPPASPMANGSSRSARDELLTTTTADPLPVNGSLPPKSASPEASPSGPTFDEPSLRS